MKTYSGIDLHSSNNYTGIIDEQDQRVYRKRLPNRLDAVLSALEPFKDSLEGVVVESTFNWYWLVDGLKEHGYKVHLANPSAIKQYEGLKHTDDFLGLSNGQGLCLNQVNLSTTSLDPDGPPARRAYASESDWCESMFDQNQ